MTEAEWLACGDPKVLWEHCDRRATERKKMLLRVAFCQHALTVVKQVEQYEFELSVVEACADGQLDYPVLGRVFTRLSRPAREARRPYPTFGDSPALYMEEAMIAATAPGGRATESTLAFALGAIEAAGIRGASAPLLFVAFIRDMLGNPFRPVVFSQEWRTGHTVGIASKMYEERDFPGMPVLADALEEVGCDNADILAHCREPGVHVRGCWVVDLVLGRE